jgi:hypothetical protein
MSRTGSSLSRRRLFVGVGATVAVGALLAKPVRTVIAQRSRQLIRSFPMLGRVMFSLGDSGYADWLEAVGATFSIGGGLAMQLTGVTPLQSGGARPSDLARSSAFMATFQMMNGASLSGDLIYVASTPGYIPFPVLLSASNNPATRGRVTAVFN